MIIHVVYPGDTLYAIGRKYGVSPSKIIEDNELSNPSLLTPGQTIVIKEGFQQHLVVPGQTLYSISRDFGVRVQDILDSNPQITNPNLIYPGQILTIPPRSEKLGSIEVNGYTFTSITDEVLEKTLPYLTYLSIFSYQVRPDGSLKGLNDERLINAARREKVAPLMVITNIDEDGGFSSDLAKSILDNEDVQDNLINNILNILKSKNYYGLDIDFEYVYPENKDDYNAFLTKVTNRLHEEGYIVTTALAPKLTPTQIGTLYEAHDYPHHGKTADHVILMTYEWGYTYGPPMAVAPINQVSKVLDYATSVIPSEKILMGIPNYGYNWTLPYQSGTAARTTTNVNAVDLARQIGAYIQYDRTSQSPYYYYYDGEGTRHVVWFEDARSIESKLRLVNTYGLGGVSYWTVGRYFPQNWLVLEALYDVKNVI